MSLTLWPGILEQVIDHARTCLPNEGCGLIAGSNGMATRFIPMTNSLASPTAYEMDPASLVSTLRSLRLSGEEMVAIYHSHPAGPEEPSRRDIRHAYYPEAIHLIVSFANAERPVVRAFRIIDEAAMEVELHAIV